MIMTVNVLCGKLASRLRQGALEPPTANCPPPLVCRQLQQTACRRSWAAHLRPPCKALAAVPMQHQWGEQTSYTLLPLGPHCHWAAYPAMLLLE